MSQYACPTVSIQTEPSEGNPSGVVVINESDYDKETMTLCDPVVEEPEKAEDPVAPPAPPAAKVVAPWAK